MSNDAQAKALLDLLAPALREIVREETTGIVKKNRELLEETKQAKADKRDADEWLMQTLDEQDRKRRLEASIPKSLTTNRFVLTREEARDPKKYRDMKAAAEQASAQITFVDPDADPTPMGGIVATNLKTRVLDDTYARVRYVRADVENDTGLVSRRMANEREGFKTRTWRTPADLPEHIQKELEALEAKERSHATRPRSL